ncbi:MAG TPA: 4-hydroxy-3-methylbut-2-enyl diphosphate reductase [Acidobacteriota bacterium]|nr:4-hydroxy-3-methylbut-2-enyl diphosphate reductase [Acidobacteriota bacterium]
MEIIVAEECGLCYGVRRALSLALRTRRTKTGDVATLGSLIHNPRVLADLEAQGIRAAAAPGDVRSGTVIIRSHGVSPAVYGRLARRKIDVVDATCPIVKKIQKLVESLARKAPEIVIVGDREHPETQGLLGYSRGKGLVVETEEAARALPHRKSRAVLAQSTQDLEMFQRITAALLGRTRELSVFNTICDSTRTRQKATAELAASVDTLFIVGGKTSSNTAKLFELSRRILPRTYFIESAGDITPAMLRGAERVGISGGASTPPEAIQEAVEAVRRSFDQNSVRE